MYESFAKSLYHSAAWIKLSRAYMQSKHYTCERCGRLAVICHHKKYLTPQNWRDPSIALNWDNLEALCLDCHNQEHFKKSGATRDGLRFDANGQLVEDD